MGNINIEIPERLHDGLRHLSIYKKKEIKDLVIEAISGYLKKGGGSRVSNKKIW